MHCHVNPFMMNNFYMGGHCCHHNYYNPFGATQRFIINSAFNFSLMHQAYSMMSYPMFFNNNIFNNYQQVYSMPVFQPSMPQISFPQLTMPQIQQQPSINYGEIFANNYNNLMSNNTTGTFAPATSTEPVQSVPSGPINDTGKLDKNVLNKVKQMAQNLNCDYKDLLAVINNESGFDTKAQNGGAVGLIQFTGVARAELKRVYGINVTKEQILNMTAIQQLDLAEKLWKNAKKSVFGENARLSGPDLYALIFLPARANREVLCVKGERDKNGKLLGYYEQNPMDANGDGKLTKSDLQVRLNKKRVNESIFA